MIELSFRALAGTASLAVLLAACSGEPVTDTEFQESEPELLADAIDEEAAMPLEAELSATGFELLLPVIEGRPAVLYGTVIGGAEADRLTAVRVPGARVELHETRETEEGAMTMVQQDAFPIDAGGTLTLEQGGRHGMVFDTPESFAEESQVPITLVFENAGERTVDARIDTRIGGVMADGDGAGDMDMTPRAPDGDLP